MISSTRFLACWCLLFLVRSSSCRTSSLPTSGDTAKRLVRRRHAVWDKSVLDESKRKIVIIIIIIIIMGSCIASCLSDLTLLALPIITLALARLPLQRSSISMNYFLPGTHLHHLAKRYQSQT